AERVGNYDLSHGALRVRFRVRKVYSGPHLVGNDLDVLLRWPKHPTQKIDLPPVGQACVVFLRSPEATETSRLKNPPNVTFSRPVKASVPENFDSQAKAALRRIAELKAAEKDADSKRQVKRLLALLGPRIERDLLSVSPRRRDQRDDLVARRIYDALAKHKEPGFLLEALLRSWDRVSRDTMEILPRIAVLEKIAKDRARDSAHRYAALWLIPTERFRVRSGGRTLLSLVSLLDDPVAKVRYAIATLLGEEQRRRRKSIRVDSGKYVAALVEAWRRHKKDLGYRAVLEKALAGARFPKGLENDVPLVLISADWFELVPGRLYAVRYGREQLKNAGIEVGTIELRVSARRDSATSIDTLSWKRVRKETDEYLTRLKNRNDTLSRRIVKAAADRSAEGAELIAFEPRLDVGRYAFSLSIEAASPVKREIPSRSKSFRILKEIAIPDRPFPPRRGRLRTTLGEPLSGFVEFTLKTDYVRRKYTIDNDGRWSYDSLPTGHWDAKVWFNSFVGRRDHVRRSVTQRHTVPSDPPLDLKVDAGRVLELRFRQSDPVIRYGIFVRGHPCGGDPTRWVQFKAGGNTPRPLRSIRIADFPEGGRLELFGYAQPKNERYSKLIRVDESLVAGQPHSVDLSFETPETIPIRIVDRRGRSVTGAFASPDPFALPIRVGRGNSTSTTSSTGPVESMVRISNR
ncbi:MAG: hypothetical protein AAF517_25830, partial [Planctomycetota bacterium]